MTPDPIGLDGGINLYAYVKNNPINAIDPKGLQLECGDTQIFPTLEELMNNPRTRKIHMVIITLVPAIIGVPMPGMPGGTYATRSTIRIRHYTNKKGLVGIRRDGVIKASDQNKVFAEKASGKPLSPRDAEAKYGLKTGRGRNIVETDVPAERVNRVKNPVTGVHELQIRGDVPLTNSTYLTR